MLRAEDLTVAAGRPLVSFDVTAGRCLGLLGPSAPDISRLLLTAAGLCRPVTGTVHIDGLDTVTQPADARRGVAINRRSAMDQRLRLAEYLRTVARVRRDVRTSADAAIERLGLNGTRRLNTAQARAEAALAAALLPAVGLIVLDEPFADLSEDTRTRAIDWIRALAVDPVAIVIGGREERDLRAVSHLVITLESPR